MFVSEKSAAKSFNVCCGLFVALSLIPELLLIGVNCASYLYLSSSGDDDDQRRLIIWNLSLAGVILLFKAIQLPLLCICLAQYRPDYLLSIFFLWFLLNSANVILAILISIDLSKDKLDDSIYQSLPYATITVLSIVLAFMLLVCFTMIGRIGWVIHQDDNRL